MKRTHLDQIEGEKSKGARGAAPSAGKEASEGVRVGVQQRMMSSVSQKEATLIMRWRGCELSRIHPVRKTLLSTLSPPSTVSTGPVTSPPRALSSHSSDVGKGGEKDRRRWWGGKESCMHICRRGRCMRGGGGCRSGSRVMHISVYV